MKAEDFKWKLGRIFYDLAEGKISVLDAYERYDTINQQSTQKQNDIDNCHRMIGHLEEISINKQNNIDELVVMLIRHKDACWDEEVDLLIQKHTKK